MDPIPVSAFFKLDNGLYVRVLEDVNCASFMLDIILVKRRNNVFFVGIVYEKLPEFCGNFGIHCQHVVGMVV